MHSGGSPQDLPREIAEARFRRLYAEHGRDILAYALRRTSDPEVAADVLAETFLVAWRRTGDVPSGPDARLWLYGVARRTLANQRRGERRRERLTERLRAELSDALPVEPPSKDRDGPVMSALNELAAEDREILMLVGWEGLSPAQAARALDISAVAARSRLHRARRRLRRALAGVGASPPAEESFELEEER